MMLRSSLCIVFLFATNPSFGMQIDWRVEHPYRYYRHHSDVEIHRWAYEELKSEAPQAAAHAPISHMERKLNNPSWWDEVKIKQLAELRSAEGKTPKRPTKEMIKFGWASFLRSSPQGYVDGTCWNSKKQNHSRCDESDRLGTTGQRTRYLKPKYHNIVLKLVDADATTLSRPCLWEASSEVLLQTASEAERSLVEVPTCSETVRARIPYFDNSSDAAVMISVTSQNGAKLSTKVHVKDYLIFGLGDSFSSGEGNPEIPARLSKTRAIGPTKPRLADMDEVNGRTTFFGVPRREPADGASAAKWTDRRCHRSVYSYQNRVALQLAIAPDEKGNHHHAITFLHFACSGAEVSEDIFFAWEGRECIGRARQLHRSGGTLGRGIRHRYYMPQISKASVALCGESQPSHWSRLSDIVGRIDNKNGLSDRDHYRRQRNQFRQNPSNHCDFKREDFGMNPRLLYCRKEDRQRNVDLILSTAGGNDVGFSGIIANTIVSVSGVDLIRPFYPDMFVDENGAKERLKFLPHRLKIYDRALEAFLGVENRPSREKPVIAMLYPNLIYKSVSGGGERFCGADNTVMDVSPFLGIRNRDALKVVERLVEGKRGNGQSYDGLIETIRTSAGALGWAIVDSHRRAFREHGICAVDPAASPNESGTGTAEIPSIPYKRVDLTRSGTTAQYANPWRGYDPVTDLYPYESRKTWFRTPNQDYLNIHHYKDNMPANWTLDSNVVSARFLANRILGGSFHPTAEGHAHIADHVYCKSRAILFGEPCDPAAVNNQAHRW